MEENMEIDNEHTNVEAVVRPIALKNVCILSFIMCGFMILIQLWSLKTSFFPSQEDIVRQQQQMEIIKAMNPEGYGAMIEMVKTKDSTALFNLFIQLLSLLGVVMMWQLNKKGFYIYVFAELFYYVISLLISGVSGLSAIANSFGEATGSLILVMILMILVDLFFISIYYKNLKFMS